MGKRGLLGVLVLSTAILAGAAQENEQEGWISLFDGKSLQGWKVAENPGSVSVKDGMIVCHGPRAHAYYVGPVKNHDFRNFELKADVMTTTGANSGVFFHTEFQEKGSPRKGYEAQVNTSHRDPVKTGSLHAIEAVNKALSRDGEWFEYQITVRDKRIVTKVNGKTVVDYTEPPNPKRPRNRQGRVLSSGTIALQAHDPASARVYYKNIRIKPLPD